MIITYEGVRHEFDMDKVTVKQAIKIERHMGCSLAEWGAQLEGGSSGLALQAFGWLILHGGRDVPIEDTDFEMVSFGEAVNAAMAAEAADAGPTSAAGNGHAATLAPSMLSSATLSP